MENDFDTPRNDTDTAKRLIDEHGHEMRYVADLGGWYVWDGKRWEPDVRNRSQELAKDTARNILAWALMQAEPDKDTVKYANGRLNRHAIGNTLTLAESDPRVVAKHADFDQNDWTITCQNGTLDLKTGELHPHDPADLNSMIANVDYDPDARCPKWIAFLNESFAGRSELVDYYQRVFGYLLTGSAKEQLFWVNFGPGGNGKSTLASVLHEMMGDYAAVMETKVLMEAERGGSDRDYFIAQLAGKRFAYASETNEQSTIDAAVIKRLTGERWLNGRSPFGKPFSFLAQFKIVLAFNEKPKIRDTTEGMWRRVKMVPFPHKPAKPNENLFDELMEEANGIFAWAVAGCLEYVHNGLQLPEIVEYETDSYRRDMDTIGRFMGEMLWMHDADSRTDQRDTFKAYQEWCLNNGERPKQQHNFNEDLKRRGLTTTQHPRTRRVQWIGLRLRNDDDVEPEEQGAKICEDDTFAPSAQAQSGPEAGCEDCEAAPPIKSLYVSSPTPYAINIGELSSHSSQLSLSPGMERPQPAKIFQPRSSQIFAPRQSDPSEVCPKCLSNNTRRRFDSHVNPGIVCHDCGHVTGNVA